MWFQVILTMLTPVAMLAVGLRWRKHPPRLEGNGLAYRTALSEQNEDTWRFAHANLSKLWVRLGLALAVVSAGAAYFGRSLLGTLFLWIIGGQMIFLCLSAFLVDGLLKANFNEDGSPAKKQ